jgi:hypothetical protein
VTERRQTISEIFDKGTPIDAAARRAVRQAIGKSTKAKTRPKSATRRSKRPKAA